MTSCVNHGDTRVTPRRPVLMSAVLAAAAWVYLVGVFFALISLGGSTTQELVHPVSTRFAAGALSFICFGSPIVCAGAILWAAVLARRSSGVGRAAATVAAVIAGVGFAPAVVFVFAAFFFSAYAVDF